MKIEVTDFCYRGHHFDRYEVDMPHVGNVPNEIDEFLEEKIIAYIKEHLDIILDEQKDEGHL